jgi:hypothetical protein
MILKPLGYTDIKAVKRWCKRNCVPIIYDNRRNFVIEEIFNEQLQLHLNNGIKANDIKPAIKKKKSYQPQSHFATDFLNELKKI